MAVEVDRSHVTNACRTAEERNDSFLKSVTASKDAYLQLAGTISLNGIDLGEQMGELKAGLEKLIKLHAEVDAHTRALQQVRSQHQPPAAPEKSNYDALLKEHMNGDTRLSNFTTEGHSWLADLQKELGEEVEAEDKDEDLGSDEELAEVGAARSFQSMTCLITGKHLLDIVDPVEDDLGYIYEKEGILAHIRTVSRGGTFMLHPMSGVNRQLRVSELKECKRLKKEQRKVRMGLPSILKPAANEDEVLHVDE